MLDEAWFSPVDGDGDGNGDGNGNRDDVSCGLRQFCSVAVDASVLLMVMSFSGAAVVEATWFIFEVPPPGGGAWRTSTSDAL